MVLTTQGKVVRGTGTTTPCPLPCHLLPPTADIIILPPWMPTRVHCIPGTLWWEGSLAIGPTRTHAEGRSRTTLMTQLQGPWGWWACGWEGRSAAHSQWYPNSTCHSRDRSRRNSIAGSLDRTLKGGSSHSTWTGTQAPPLPRR